MTNTTLSSIKSTNRSYDHPGSRLLHVSNPHLSQEHCTERTEAQVVGSTAVSIERNGAKRISSPLKISEHTQTRTIDQHLIQVIGILPAENHAQVNIASKS